jgi:putative tryptophan/tyrosine transport system substrate-binding protein
MAYGTNFFDQYKRAAAYVDKILKGTKPADLPVEQASRFEFVINIKTAKMLGVTIPPTLLAIADDRMTQRERRKAFRSSRPAADQIRAGDQS